MNLTIVADCLFEILIKAFSSCCCFFFFWGGGFFSLLLYIRCHCLYGKMSVHMLASNSVDYVDRVNSKIYFSISTVSTLTVTVSNIAYTSWQL